MIVMIIIPVLFYLDIRTCSAFHNFQAGSRAAAMGNAAITSSDLWSLYHNQAGLASMHTVHAGFHYENRFLVPELGFHALALAFPARPGTIGIGYSHFGFSGYHENKLGLAFARLYGKKFATGIRINYLHRFIAGGYGRSGRLLVEGGITVQPFEGVVVAAHIYNPAGAKMADNHNRSLPVITRIGISKLSGENLLVAAEIEKEQDSKVVFRTGLELGFSGPFYLRCGLGTRPVQTCFGMGYTTGKLSADMAFTNHRILGFSPHITVSYIIG